MLFIATSLTGCGDDNNEPVIPDDKTVSVNADYSVSLSNDYFDLWDIEITYTDAGGNLKSEVIESDWMLNLKLLAIDKIPTHYELKVIGKPKVTLPTIDPDRIYNLGYECQITVAGYKADGSLSFAEGMGIPDQSSLSTDGKHLENIISKERIIFSRSVSISLD